MARFADAARSRAVRRARARGAEGCVRATARRTERLHPRGRDRGRAHAGHRRAARRPAAPTTGPRPPACSPPRSPPAPRSRSRCTRTARAGSWARSRSTSTSSTARSSPIEPSTVDAAGARRPLDDEQRERLLVIAGKCPVHRALAGETHGRRSTDRIEYAAELMDLGLAGQSVRRHRRQPRDRPRAPRGCCAPRARRCCWSPAARRASPRRSRSAAPRRATAPGRGRWRSTSPTPTPASASSPRPSERFGRLDVLVNNAGTARWRDLDEVPEDDW